jgi:DNA-binding SARP family transcriptional activator
MGGILRSHRHRTVTACATVTAMQARLHLLDTPHFTVSTARAGLPASVPGLLLAYLSQQNDWVGRDTLLALFWPDAAAAEAQHNLRVGLHRARQWLRPLAADDLLDSERRRVRFRVASDVADFRAACGRADWAGALALRRAPLLAGLGLPGFAAVDEWLRSERAALDEAWRNAALRQAQALGHGGDALAATWLLGEVLQADSLAEDLVQELLRQARAAGRRDAALAAFEHLRERLLRELDAEPLPVTQALASALRLGHDAPAPRRASAAWPAALGAPPLAGREAELAQLAATHARIVVVAGEPGVGKTRLLETAHADAAWLACREAWRELALQPLAEYLDDMQANLDTLPAFASHRRTLSRLLPRLWPDELLPPLASADEHSSLLDALAEVLAALQRPVVVDDLQWADVATLEVLRRLALRAGPPLAATVRSGEITPALAYWIAALELGGELVRIDLQPLSAASIDALLVRLSGQAHGAPLFAAWLHRRSGGNPLFALETLRALFDAGRLAETADGWASDLDALTRDYSELEVAPQLAGIVRQRVQALGEPAGRTLAAAAVAGDARQLDLLAQAAELPARTVAEAIASAQAAGLLRGRTFAHELVRRALYDGIAEAPRQLLHAAFARAGAELLPAQAIAQHCWASGQTAAAIDAWLRAAARDCELGLHEQAARFLSGVLTRCDGPAQRARVLVELARTSLQQGALDTAQGHAESALLAVPAPTVRAEALALLGEVEWMQGRLDDARQRLAAAAEVDAALPSVLGLASRLAFHRGAYDEAYALLEQHCRQLRRQPPGTELIATLTSMGAACDSKAELARGLPLHREAWALAQQLGARYAQVDVACNLVWSLPELGQADEAIAIAREALALGDFDGTPTLRNNLAWLLHSRGRLDEAQALYEQLAHGADPSLRCFAWAKLVEIAARRGDAAACAAASGAALAALEATEMYQAHAAVMAAVLDHGSDADAERALRYVRDQPLDSYIQQRLDQAMARRSAAARPT